MKYTVDYLQNHKDTLKRSLDNYIQEHCVVPHPGVLLSEFTKAMGVIKRPAAAEPPGRRKRPASNPIVGHDVSSEI